MGFDGKMFWLSIRRSVSVDGKDARLIRFVEWTCRNETRRMGLRRDCCCCCGGLTISRNPLHCRTRQRNTITGDATMGWKCGSVCGGRRRAGVVDCEASYSFHGGFWTWDVVPNFVLVSVITCEGFTFAFFINYRHQDT